jgi:hypothetical protein
LGSLPDLAGSEADPLVGAEFVEAHGAAGAEFIGADANLGPHAELAAVGEAGRGVPIDRGRIDVLKELSSGRFVPVTMVSEWLEPWR